MRFEEAFETRPPTIEDVKAAVLDYLQQQKSMQNIITRQAENHRLLRNFAAAIDCWDEDTATFVVDGQIVKITGNRVSIAPIQVY
jgi:hypothetical protein